MGRARADDNPGEFEVNVQAIRFRRPATRGPGAVRLLLVATLALAVAGPFFLRAADAGVLVPRTAISVGSGLWSDPATWRDGRAPGAGTAVTIAVGTVVILDVDATVSGIAVDGGLGFDPTRSVRLLSTRNIVVAGTLAMKPDSPVLVHRLRFVGVDDSKFVGGGTSVLASDVGLWVTGAGRLDLQGAPKTAWLHLAGGLRAGQSAGIALEQSPVGWRPGDEVFVAPTTPPAAPRTAAGKASWSGFESTSLTGIAGDTVTLATPAQRTHPVVGGRWTAEIGDLTRNVKIEGTATGYSHVFIHSTAPQTVRFVELTYMGTDRVIGRYPLHFHHDGDGSRGSVVDGVVVHKSMNHAFVPHASNGITFTDTIAFDIGHSAYWWDPDTTVSRGNGSGGIVFDHAIAAAVFSKTGIRLAGFRLGQGPDLTNTVRDSVAVGIQGSSESSGFQWLGGASNWNFSDNIAHNNKVLGILVWQNDHVNQDVNGFTEYYSKTGILHGAYKNQYHYRDVTLYGNSSTGLTLLATAKANGIVFDRLHVDGAGITQIGVFSCCHQLDGTTYPTTLSNCSVDRTVFGSVWMGVGRSGATALHVANCALGAKPFYFQAGTPSAGAIEVTGPTGNFRLTPTASNAASTFNSAWNAWSSPLP
ncbi:MAG TPA: G8 domain-containing protein [Acidimicrobiia bacterium]